MSSDGFLYLVKWITEKYVNARQYYCAVLCLKHANTSTIQFIKTTRKAACHCISLTAISVSNLFLIPTIVFKVQEIGTSML